MTTPTNRHRAEIIEVYENGARAAARFASGRVECVCRRGMMPTFEVGQRGWVDYTRCLSGYEWTFVHFVS
jgi:hypothetical protein